VTLIAALEALRHPKAPTPKRAAPTKGRPQALKRAGIARVLRHD